MLTLFFMLPKNSSADSKNDQQKAFDPNSMNLSVKPGTDFFQYANGNWCKNNPIPPEYSRYGSFDILQEQNHDNIKQILEAAASDKNAKMGSVAQKIGDFYSAGLDTLKIEKDGYNPIKHDLEQINRIKTISDIIKEVAHQHKFGGSSFFNFGSGQDEKNSEQVIAQLYQGGLGLGDRDYYLSQDKRSTELRA